MELTRIRPSRKTGSESVAVKKKTDLDPAVKKKTGSRSGRQKKGYGSDRQEKPDLDPAVMKKRPDLDLIIDKNRI